MGVIQRQTIKGTLYSYLGVGLGFINLVILSPKIFSADEIGLIQVLVAMAVILAQFASLGFNITTVRMFPYFRNDENRHNGYLGLGFIVTLVGFIIVSILLVLCKPLMINHYSENSDLLTEFLDWLIPLLYLILFYNLLDTYARVMYKAAFGSFLREVLIRILNLGFLIAVYFQAIDFKTYVILYISSYGVTIAILGLYLIIKRQVSFRINFPLLKKYKKEMVSVATFGLIAGLSGIAKASFDKLMVNSFLDLSAAGIYSIAFYFGTLIIIPQRAMSKISSTIIAEAWKKSDMQVISKTYYQSSINQLVVGVFVFLIIWLNVDKMLSYLPPMYAQGKYVILFIAIANLIEMVAGVNTQIIITSKYYKWQTYFMIVLIVSLVVSNLILIPIFGINGAAIATLISSLVYTLLRVGFLYFKYTYLPFGKNHFKVLFILAVFLILGSFAPHFSSWIVDIIIRSIVISFLYLYMSLLMNTSDELRKVYFVFINKIFKRNEN